jgi:hypothetical protein
MLVFCFVHCRERKIHEEATDDGRAKGSSRKLCCAAAIRLTERLLGFEELGSEGVGVVECMSCLLRHVSWQVDIPHSARDA